MITQFTWQRPNQYLKWRDAGERDAGCKVLDNFCSFKNCRRFFFPFVFNVCALCSKELEGPTTRL